MHYSAKCGFAIACRHVRPSVYLSVCDVGGGSRVGWKSWKLIAWTISQHLRSSWPKGHPPGEHGEIRGRLEVGWEKVACWSTKAAISLKRVKIDDKLLWIGGPIEIHQSSFERCHLREPSTASSCQDWNPHPKLQSLCQEMVKLRTSNLAGTFTGCIRTKAY